MSLPRVRCSLLAPASSRWSHRLAALLAAAALVLTLGATPGRAAARVLPSYDLELVSQPIWYGVGGPRSDRLDLVVRITNDSETPLRGFSIVLTAGGRVVSRSELDSILGGGSFSGTTTSLSYVDRTVAPGHSATLSVTSRLASLPSLRAAEGGVYPLSVSLDDLSASPVRLSSFTTPLIVYPQRPDPPLRLVPVVSLQAQPARDPGGIFTPQKDSRLALYRAVGPGGWLRGMLDAAQSGAGAGLHLALAPTPRLIEEIGDMAGGYRRASDGGGVKQVARGDSSPRHAAAFLSKLAKLAGKRTVQLLDVPYSAPDLPTMTANLTAPGGVLSLLDQLREGGSVLESSLGRSPNNWLFPPGGRLDQPTLTALRLANAARHTVFAAGSLRRPHRGCPETSGALTFACAVRVKTSAGASGGLVADAGLTKLLRGVPGAGRETRLQLQRFFADTAMIREEQPNVGGRVVTVIVPESWHPAARTSLLFLGGLASAPWLATATPREGLRDTHAPVDRRLASRLHPPADSPNPAYWSEISQALSAVETFASMNPPAAIRRELSRSVLVAESRSWWAGPRSEAHGLAYASDAASRAASFMHSVSLPSVNSTQTLTSHSGDLQIVAFNDAAFPLTVRLEFQSTKLGFRRQSIERTLVPGKTERIPIRATARSSGIFSMLVSVETPDGAQTITDQSIEIRSTNFNVIALVLTIGALAFLVFFYLARRLRKTPTNAVPRSLSPNPGDGRAP